MNFLAGFLKTAKAETFKMKATPKKHGGKSGRRVYKLTKDKRKWTCTCPDFVYRRAEAGTECKHIRAQKAGKMPWEVDPSK